MLQTILGKKIAQLQEFDEAGNRIPVTVIAAGPCYITAARESKSGTLVQLGYDTKKNISKAESGHLKKAGLEFKLRFLRTVKTADDVSSFTLGSAVDTAAIFSQGDHIRVSGTGIGKGFAGVVKRHNFRGGPRTHGQSDRERAPGSIGQTTTPGRVYRGKRMAGRMGQDKVTIRGLKVISYDPSTYMLKIKGLVPGSVNSYVIVSKDVR